MDNKDIKKIQEIIKHATFVFISEETSREDLLEIIEAQLGFWDELEDYLNSPNKPKTNG